MLMCRSNAHAFTVLGIDLPQQERFRALFDKEEQSYNATMDLEEFDRKRQRRQDNPTRFHEQLLPTEYRLTEDDVRIGLKFLRYYGALWPLGDRREMMIYLATFEDVTFTWDDLAFAPIDDPESPSSNGVRVAEQVAQPRPVAIPGSTVPNRRIVHVRPMFGSAEHALSQQQLRRGIIPQGLQEDKDVVERSREETVSDDGSGVESRAAHASLVKDSSLSG